MLTVQLDRMNMRAGEHANEGMAHLKVETHQHHVQAHIFTKRAHFMETNGE